ncbi:PilZ domain-containing protein [Desulfosarcina cetonica]|uniref:PilZ domain-containing protein n=1 Tax=Desulfosarcina cetonica TaxID=90730 RepID=UPI0012EEA428|nr:PilZ domain-containing protein [Desulfosarcina cetonica]
MTDLDPSPVQFNLPVSYHIFIIAKLACLLLRIPPDKVWVDSPVNGITSQQKGFGTMAQRYDIYGICKRAHDRKRYESDVVFANRDQIYKGSLKNIGLGGAYIQTPSANQFSIADIIIINIPFPSGKKDLKRKARVKWLNNEGFAVEFI